MPKNKEKITKELLWKNDVIFFPKTGEEAAAIQNKLFALGYRWAGREGQNVMALNECLATGLVLLRDGKIYYRGNTDDRDYLVCNLSQFEGNHAAVLLTAEEQVSLLEKFNELSARTERLTAMVEAIYTEIMPKILDKPAFKRQAP